MFRQWILSLLTIAMLTAASRAQEPRGVSMSLLAMPESMIYFLLRDRAAGSTEQRAETERSLPLFRAYAHDRRRQVEDRWLRPGDFQHRREAFREVCKEAQNHFRQAGGKREPTRRERLAQSRHLAAGRAKLRQAAGAWADPLLRSFLLADAAMQSGNLGLAENLFARCAEDEPRVAAFHQGRARALMGLKRYSEALRAYMQVLAMKPDSREAVQLLRQALQDAPGSNLETPAFREARELLQAYPDDSARRPASVLKTTDWLLPGKAVRGKENALPDLPMDRLVVRQATATPVAEHTLLVDGRVLQDADEVLVQIDPKTLVTATVRGSYRRGDGDIPMTLITLPDYTFTPRPTFSGDLSSDESLVAHTVNTYTEMGGAVREQPVKVLPRQDGYATNPHPALADGESAGILLTGKGQLAGVVVRDLDVMKDSPAEKVYVPADLAPLLKRMSKPSSHQRTKRTITPKDAPGEIFTVYAVQAERLSGK